MSDKELLVKHLEMIQGVINRMAHNSFLIKGWSITILTAIILFASSSSALSACLISVFIALVLLAFWILDGYFLWQERLYRALYNHVRELKKEDIDFSMDTNKYKKQKKNTFLCSMFSVTLLIFYLILISIASFIVYWLK